MREHGSGARKEVFSGADEAGDSIKGLLGKLYQAADIPVTVDDFKGSKATAQAGSPAVRDLERRRPDARHPHRRQPHHRGAAAAIITTGETSTTGSSATRALTIRVGYHAPSRRRGATTSSVRWRSGRPGRPAA